ncbi:MAG: Asp-tRNA(Asn)/Glu-tRNA(Gln) amidotransferase GatCAB subunit B, partial [Ignisphaera sp.]
EGYIKIEDETILERMIIEVMDENPKAVKDALENPKAVNYIVGLVMKKTKGRADPVKTIEIVKKLLDRYRS